MLAQARLASALGGEARLKRLLVLAAILGDASSPLSGVRDVELVYGVPHASSGGVSRPSFYALHLPLCAERRRRMNGGPLAGRIA